jgi:Uma2 family endonuclease
MFRVSVVCDPKKITDKGCSGAPDFIIEVVSPSSRRMDYNIKNSLYATSGVREYWIVDPQKERTTVYRYEEDAAPIIIPFSNDIQVGIYRDFSVNIAEML